jgi:hypothetical protein
LRIVIVDRLLELAGRAPLLGQRPAQPDQRLVHCVALILARREVPEIVMVEVAETPSAGNLTDSVHWATS